MQSEIITKMIAHIVSECTKIDAEKAFDDMLDECYSFDKVGGPFSGMSPSRVLRECDPIAHRCGVNDYADGQRDCWYEIEGDWYEQREVDKAKEGFIEDLTSELADLENEEAEQDNIHDEANREDKASELVRLDAIRDQVKRKEAEIKECDDHSF